MIWATLVLALVGLIVLVNLRIFLRERIRLRCLDQAIESRSFHGRVYSHAEKTEIVLARAYAYEDFVMSGKPKEEQAPDPPPTPPPGRYS